MVDNPYDPPLLNTPPIVQPPGGRTANRPMGVSILSALLMLSGLMLLVAQITLFATLKGMEETLNSIGIPPYILLFGVIFLTALTIASGVGMWMGTKWGWWLGSFYYVYSVFRNGSALLSIGMMTEQFEDTSRGVEYYMAKHGSRAVFSFLLFLYFFKRNVLEYFGMEGLNKSKAIGILGGICIAITAFTYALANLSS